MTIEDDMEGTGLEERTGCTPALPALATFLGFVPRCGCFSPTYALRARVVACEGEGTCLLLHLERIARSLNSLNVERFRPSNIETRYGLATICLPR